MDAYLQAGLDALGDATRMAIFQKLSGGPIAVNELARMLPVSRPAVSQHLKALKEAGLVADRPEGARRIYFVDPKGLAAIRRWLDEFWDEALAAYQSEVEARASENRLKTKRKPKL